MNIGTMNNYICYIKKHGDIEKLYIFVEEALRNYDLYIFLIVLNFWKKLKVLIERREVLC